MSSFVICINNDGNHESLIVGKVYRKLDDKQAEVYKMVRVIDEDKSEADGYLYPASMFEKVELPKTAQRVITAGAK
jgi:hypothetical protein